MIDIKKCYVAFALLLVTWSYAQVATAGPENSTWLTVKEIRAVVGSIPQLLEQHYFDKMKGKKFADAFRMELKMDKYLTFNRRDSLAAAISKDLKRITNDGHVYVVVKPATTAGHVDWEALEKARETSLNYGFTKVEIYENLSAYMKIEEFMHPKRSLATAVAAMQMVENAHHLIIDLRGNHGGYPGIMEYILSLYFDGPPTLLSKTYFNDGTYSTTHSTDLLQGKLRAGTPLYILIDKGTASAAEFFAYTLQVFGKAKVIGTSSAGGANRNDYFDLPHDFRMSISVASPVNQLTNGNWEGTGVIPDIETSTPLEVAKAIIKEKTGAQ